MNASRMRHTVAGIACVVATVGILRSSARGTEAGASSQGVPRTQVVILGTIHRGHLDSPWYKPEVVKEILVALKPQAILVEFPQNLMEADGRLGADIREYDSDAAEGWAADQASSNYTLQLFHTTARNETNTTSRLGTSSGSSTHRTGWASGWRNLEAPTPSTSH